MDAVSGYLGSRLKSIHLRLRFAKADMRGIEERDLRGYVSRVSNIINAWRLQFRLPQFAMRAPSQKRSHPDTLTTSRGTVRLIDLGTHWDIEIRGYMNKVDKLEETISILREGLNNPEKMRGYWELEQALSLRKYSLPQYLELQGRERGVILSPKVFALMSRLDADLIYSGHLPLYGFEEDPTLTTKQRDRFAGANEQYNAALLAFGKRIETLSDEYINLNYRDKMQAEYMDITKTWVSAVELSKALTYGIKEIPMTEAKQRQTRDFLEGRLAAAAVSVSDQIKGRANVVMAQKNGEPEFLSPWARAKISETLEGREPHSNVLLLIEGQGAQWQSLLLECIESSDPNVRRLAWEVTGERPEADVSTEYLISRFRKAKETNPQVLKSMGYAFFHTSRDVPFDVREKLIRADGVELATKAKALEPILLLNDKESVALLDWAFGEGNLRAEMKPYLEKIGNKGTVIPESTKQIISGTYAKKPTAPEIPEPKIVPPPVLIENPETRDEIANNEADNAIEREKTAAIEKVEAAPVANPTLLGRCKLLVSKFLARISR